MRGGNECEILILPFPSISVLCSHTRAVSHAHMLPPHRWIRTGGRARPAASGEMCLFREHYAITLRSLCGSHTVPESDRRRRKRKMDITPYRFFMHAYDHFLRMFLRRRGDFFSPLPPLSLPLPLSRGHSGNSPMKKRNFCHLSAR